MAEKRCPICGIELCEPLPDICEQCGWDIEDDITLKLVVGNIPDKVVQKYLKQREIAERAWKERIAAKPKQDIRSDVPFDEIKNATKVMAQLGHFAKIKTIAITPDGRKIVSGSTDHTIILWDLKTGSKIRTFRGHTDEISSIAITPDGRHIVSGSIDSRIIIWDIETGLQVRQIKGSSRNILSIAITPNGRYIISGSNHLEKYDLVLWDFETGEKIREFEKTQVFSIAVTKDSKYIISGSIDGDIILWDLETGHKISTFKHDGSWVLSLALTPDGKNIVSGCNDTIVLWDIETNRQIRTFYGHSSKVLSIAVSNDGKYMVSGSQDKTIIIWDLATGSQIRKLEGHSDACEAIAITPNNRYIVSGSKDTTIIIWDIAEGRQLRKHLHINLLSYIDDDILFDNALFDKNNHLPILNRSLFESQYDFIYSIINSPPVFAGKCQLMLDRYNSKTKVLPLEIEWNPWAQNTRLIKGKLILLLEQSQVNELYTSGVEGNLFVNFKVDDITTRIGIYFVVINNLVFSAYNLQSGIVLAGEGSFIKEKIEKYDQKYVILPIEVDWMPWVTEEYPTQFSENLFYSSKEICYVFVTDDLAQFLCDYSEKYKIFLETGNYYYSQILNKLLFVNNIRVDINYVYVEEKYMFYAGALGAYKKVKGFINQKFTSIGGHLI